ncbi:LamG domain-containing protein [Paenibacillus sp. YIM B09110]|uniref:LamG domain-containing protein n=1 Tax=Paenibacillus sp. YIM B09110 TaxID=3126102 RepID=UPI00301CD86E
MAASTIVLDSLVFYYNGKQGATPTAWQDLGPNGYNLVVDNGAVQADGYYFNGTTRATIEPKWIPIPSSYTLEFAFKMPDSTISNYLIFAYRDGAELRAISLNSAEVLRVYDGVTQNLTSYTVPLNTMVFIAIRRVNATTQALYVNGVFHSNFTVTQDTTGFSGELILGTDDGGGNFVGHIAFLRQYSRALTDTEIADNYSIGTAVGLVSSGVAHTKSLSDIISTSDTKSKRLSVAVIDVVNASETESEHAAKKLADTVTATDSVASKRSKAINVSDSVVITDTLRKALTLNKSDAVITAESEREEIQRKLADILATNDVINVTGGKAVLIADSLTLTDTLRKTLSKAVVETVGVAENVGRNVSARLYDVVLTAETLNAEQPNVPAIIGTIALKGNRELNVYLLGSRVLDVALRGEV